MVLEKVDEAAKEKEKKKDADVYEIGKRFLYWVKYKKHKDYVKATRQSVKEEIFHSPVLSGLFTKTMWDNLTRKVEVTLNMKVAKKLRSNARVCHVLELQQFF